MNLLRQRFFTMMINHGNFPSTSVTTLHIRVHDRGALQILTNAGSPLIIYQVVGLKEYPLSIRKTEYATP